MPLITYCARECSCLIVELVDGVQNKVCGTYVQHTLHSCTLYVGNVCIGGDFEVSTTRKQILLIAGKPFDKCGAGSFRLAPIK